MTPLAVWAPRARAVELALCGRRVRMRRSDGGWFRCEVPERGPFDYGFALDGGSPLPDPRSRWQPHGVAGLSRADDPAAFAWSDAGFRPEPLARAVLYELHVGTFSAEGTFLGAIAHLDHLRALGVTHIELMPVAAFSGAHGWGYDGVAPFAPHPAYGSPDELRALVDACHARGLAVVFDVVHNHFGPEGCVLPRYGPYLREGADTAWGAGPNLDGPDSDEVRRFLIDGALAWLRDYHGDALRLDAVDALVDRSPLPFLEELRAAVDQLGLALQRPLLLIAEADGNDPRLVRPRGLGGTGLDALWCDDFHHALHAFATGERQGYYADFGSCADVVETLARGLVYAGRYSAYRRRRHGRFERELAGHQLVSFLQNHDQIGNRAQGDRLAAALPPDRLRALSGLLLTAPLVPLLFQGEEWAATTPFPYFCDLGDEPLRDAVRRGRGEGLDPCARETFLAARLDWSELERARHREVLEWTRALIRLRRGCPGLGAGRLLGGDVRCSEKEGWIRFRRGPLHVFAHFGSAPAALPLDGAPAHALLASRPDFRIGRRTLELAPDRFVVLGPPLRAPGEKL